MEEYLVAKAPIQIPESGRDAIVKFLPWIIIVFMVLALPIVLALLGIGTVFAPFAFLGGVGSGFTYLATGVLTLVVIVLEALALPGLFAAQERGWRLLFYSNLVSVLSGLFSSNPIGSLVFALLSFYILFQIKSRYR